MTWAVESRRLAAEEATKRGHELGEFEEWGSVWRTKCRRCGVDVEAWEGDFLIATNGECMKSKTVKVRCSSCSWRGRRSNRTTTPCSKCGGEVVLDSDIRGNTIPVDVTPETGTGVGPSPQSEETAVPDTAAVDEDAPPGRETEGRENPEPASVRSLDFIQEKRHLSFSQLSTYSECGEKYRLRYVEGVPTKPSGALIGGKAVHETIEVAEREDWWKDEENFFPSDAPAIATYREILERHVEEATEEIRWGGRGQGEDYPWWIKNGEFMLRRYRATREAMDASGWGVVQGGVEMRVLADLPGVSVPVLGFLDKFLMHEGGETIIVDYSTGRVGGKNAFQFATYSRLLYLAREITCTRGVAIYLRAGDANKRVEAMQFEPLVDHMDETYANLYRGIEAELFIPNPSSFCSSCFVNQYCWSWMGSQGKEPLG
jgi:CRISPR/Cas system-associated exonuclease Cas4 (RecB family)